MRNRRLLTLDVQKAMDDVRKIADRVRGKDQEVVDKLIS
jgi:hypothetical protein